MRSICLIACLAACTPFPELEGTISDSARAAPYPVLSGFPALPEATPIEADALTLRVAALRSRAARLRQIDIAALQ